MFVNVWAFCCCCSHEGRTGWLARFAQVCEDMTDRTGETGWGLDEESRSCTREGERERRSRLLDGTSFFAGLEVAHRMSNKLISSKNSEFDWLKLSNRTFCFRSNQWYHQKLQKKNDFVYACRNLAKGRCRGTSRWQPRKVNSLTHFCTNFRCCFLARWR